MNDFGSPAGERRAFRVWLLGIVAVGLVIRLVVVALASRDLPFGDGIWYHTQAQIISGGFGYLAPGQYVFKAQHLATAEHPPLFPFVLAVVNWFANSSVVLFQTTCAVLGAAGIAAIGLLGRAVGGARLGLTAAALCAVAPNIWQYDALVLSESLLVLTAGLFLLSLYRFAAIPSSGRAAVVGLTLAVATYNRTEMVLLGLLLVPLVWRNRQLVWRNRQLVGLRGRFRVLGVAAGVTIALLAPWVIRNLTTFNTTVVFSNNQDSVIAGANCDNTYYGSDVGSWNPVCNTGNTPKGLDQSEVFARFRERGVHYASDHLDRLPVVAAARVGRAWDVFRPFQGMGNDGRSDGLTIASALSFYVLVVLGAFGAVQLHRAGRRVWPLLVMAPFVSVIAAAGYGISRLRFPLDIVLLVLAAAPLARFIPWPGQAPEAEVFGLEKTKA